MRKLTVLQAQKRNAAEQTDSAVKKLPVLLNARKIISDDKTLSDFASVSDKTDSALKKGSIFSRARKIMSDNEMSSGSSCASSDFGSHRTSAFTAFTNRSEMTEDDDAPSIVWDLFPKK